MAAASLAAAAFAGPSYDAEGKIIIPENMDRWPTVGTTYALSYEGDGGTTLNTVRLDPESYDAYVKTGKFPVGAIFALEVRTAGRRDRAGQGRQDAGRRRWPLAACEGREGRAGHVDVLRLWREREGRATPIPRSQACYSCHDEHAGKTDTVFMQYYPTLERGPYAGSGAEGAVGAKPESFSLVTGVIPGAC